MVHQIYVLKNARTCSEPAYELYSRFLMSKCKYHKKRIPILKSAPVESLNTCQCTGVKLQLLLPKIYHKLSKIWKGSCAVLLRGSNPTEKCWKEPKLKCQVILLIQHIPGLKTVSWGQCTLYFSLVSADQLLQQKPLKTKHRNKLIASN